MLSCLICLVLTCVVEGLGPAYGGDEFVRLKSIPPAMVAARSSGSLTLSCSTTGSPTPKTSWYKDGVRISGTESSPGGLGESHAKLHLPCLTKSDEGVYECRGKAAGQEDLVKVMLNFTFPASQSQMRECMNV